MNILKLNILYLLLFIIISLIGAETIFAQQPNYYNNDDYYGVNYYDPYFDYSQDAYNSNNAVIERNLKNNSIYNNNSYFV